MFDSRNIVRTRREDILVRTRTCLGVLDLVRTRTFVCNLHVLSVLL